MAKYTVVGEGETIEVLGVLRQAGEVLSLLEKDAQPEVDRGVLVPVAEEVTEPASTEPPTDGNVEATSETVGGGVETANAETVETQPVADGDVPPTPEATVPTEPATGTEPVAPATEPVQQ